MPTGIFENKLCPREQCIWLRHRNENKQRRLKDGLMAAVTANDDKIGAEFPTN